MDESEKLDRPVDRLMLRLRTRSRRLGGSESAGELGPEIQPPNSEEHRIVDDQRNAPADRGRGDPQISVMEPLV